MYLKPLLMLILTHDVKIILQQKKRLINQSICICYMALFVENNHRIYLKKYLKHTHWCAIYNYNDYPKIFIIIDYENNNYLIKGNNFL